MYASELTNASPCVEMVSSYFGGVDDVWDHTLTVASRDTESIVVELAKATTLT
jgi:hypothetical protein